MVQTFTELLVSGDEYAEARATALLELHGAGERLYDAAVQLAMKGPWREEAEAAAVGAVISVSHERLRATGNPHILALCDAYDALHAAWTAVLDDAAGRGG